MSVEGSPPSAQPYELPRCYRHPDRETGVSCTRCERPICPDCLRPASVGFQCPECVARGNAGLRSARAPYGGVAVDAALITVTIAVLNVVVYILTALNSTGGFRDNAGSTLFVRLGLFPAAVAINDEYWRLVTSMFVHYGPWHLLSNMLALAVVGAGLEQVFSRWRYLAVYMVAGLGGSTAVYLFDAPISLSVGASGAIFGLFGAYLVVAKKARLDYRPMLLVIGINLVATFAIPNISKLAHIGGLVTGIIAAAVIVYAPRGRNRTSVQVLGLGGMLAVMALLVLFRTTQIVV
jgi:membrane associated rhomboid family serine protease